MSAFKTSSFFLLFLVYLLPAISLTQDDVSNVLDTIIIVTPILVVVVIGCTVAFYIFRKRRSNQQQQQAVMVQEDEHPAVMVLEEQPMEERGAPHKGTIPTSVTATTAKKLPTNSNSTKNSEVDYSEETSAYFEA